MIGFQMRTETAYRRRRKVAARFLTLGVAPFLSFFLDFLGVKLFPVLRQGMPVTVLFPAIVTRSLPRLLL